MDRCNQFSIECAEYLKHVGTVNTKRPYGTETTFDAYSSQSETRQGRQPGSFQSTRRCRGKFSDKGDRHRRSVCSNGLFHCRPAVSHTRSEQWVGSRHINVKSAFVNSDMDRQAFVTSPVNLPKGIRQSDVYLLLKALYGLHQAPVLWYRNLVKALREQRTFDNET